LLALGVPQVGDLVVAAPAIKVLVGERVHPVGLAGQRQGQLDHLRVLRDVLVEAEHVRLLVLVHDLRLGAKTYETQFSEYIEILEL
jgi:hypothetical protein